MTRTPFRDGGFIHVTTAPGWAVGLAILGFAALSLIVLAIGAAFVLLLAPVAIGLALFARWRLRRFVRDLAARAPVASPRGDPRVIDAEYRVVRDEERP